MAIGRLADLHEYRLPKDVLDVRGWRVYDVTGEHTGIVEDLIVDTEAGHVLKAILHYQGHDHELPFEALTIDRRDSQVHIPYTASTLNSLPVVPGWHPVDRHSIRTTFFPDLAGVDDWGGEVEIEDLQPKAKRPI